MALNELSISRQMTVDTMAMQSGCGEAFLHGDRKWTYHGLLRHHEKPVMHVGLLLYARAGVGTHGDLADQDKPQKKPRLILSCGYDDDCGNGCIIVMIISK